MSKTYLCDDSVRLRAPEPSDVDCLFLWENDTTIWESGNAVAPYSRQQLWEYVQNYDADIFKSRQLRFIIENAESREKMGTIDLYDFDPVHNRAFVGILIAPQYRRKHVGYRTLGLLIDYAKSYLCLHQLACVTTARNTACVNLFLKSGFQHTGILKSWVKGESGYSDAVTLQYIF